MSLNWLDLTNNQDPVKRTHTKKIEKKDRDKTKIKVTEFGEKTKTFREAKDNSGGQDRLAGCVSWGIHTGYRGFMYQIQSLGLNERQSQMLPIFNQSFIRSMSSQIIPLELPPIDELKNYLDSPPTELWKKQIYLCRLYDKTIQLPNLKFSFFNEALLLIKQTRSHKRKS